jgi:hypothetical protein
VDTNADILLYGDHNIISRDMFLISASTTNVYKVRRREREREREGRREGEGGRGREGGGGRGGGRGCGYFVVRRSQYYFT